ncbi:MAG: CapA family protein, partial [Ilumatobacteraceae bacterium]
MRGDVVRLFLCGDVMLGRGIDQVLPHPGHPTLREGYVKDARTYVSLAEQVNGPIPRPVAMARPWGDALEALDLAAPDVRVINLETSITRSDDFAAGKGVHYRMSPDNIGCLSAVRADVCTLANNHVLDFGGDGLEETLDVLAAAGLAAAGAGRDADEAKRPAAVTLEGGRRVLVFSLGMVSSGIPPAWAAAADRPGVHVVEEPSSVSAAATVGRVERWKQPGDLVVASIHWGSNWGHDVHPEQTRFAHALIDGGVDIVHGHSSHHPRPIEFYRDRLILYGCGDLINDYEGIAGRAQYRSDLRLLYLADLDANTGVPVAVWMIPMQARRLRLEHADAADADWMRSVL